VHCVISYQQVVEDILEIFHLKLPGLYQQTLTQHT
jgi:hypothetical protein